MCHSTRNQRHFSQIEIATHGLMEDIAVLCFSMVPVPMSLSLSVPSHADPSDSHRDRTIGYGSHRDEFMKDASRILGWTDDCESQNRVVVSDS